MIFSISLLNSKSKATFAANNDFPDPALPRNIVTTSFKILALANFCYRILDESFS